MLKNSKAFKFLIGTFAVLALGAVVLTASAAMDFGPSTLKVGSKGEYVKNLQTLVGASPVDGIFGKGTEGKVKAWQANCGLTADGKFGPASKAKAATGCSTVITPAQGNCPTGYVAVTPVAPTFASCVASTVTNSGTNGYLSDPASDSTNRVSTVYESEKDKVVAGFRETARLADQTVTRVRVTFQNTNGSSSANLAKYISGASLWMGSTKLASMPVSMADRSTSSDIYTFNFSGLNAKVMKDQIGRFYVSVDANGSLDSTDATNATWAVKFPAAGVMANSPDGTVDTYDSASPSTGADVSGLKFGKFSANGVKATIGISTSNPAASVVTVQNTAATNGVNMLKFTIKATNSDLTLRKVPIQVVSTGNNVSTMINTIKLYNGSNVVDSLDGSAGVLVAGGVITSGACTTSCGFIFSNLSDPYNKITSGSTSEFTVVVDLKQVTGNYAEGNTLTASFKNADALLTANFGVLDANGDQLTAGSTYRIGSAEGEIQTLRVNGVQVVMGTPTFGTPVTRGGNAAGSQDVMTVTYKIPLTVTAFGQTLYAGQTAQYAATPSGTQAVAFGFNDAAAPGTAINSGAPATAVSAATTAPTLTSSDAAVEAGTSSYRLDAGVAKHFMLTVTLQSTSTVPAAATHSLRVALNKFATWTDNLLSTGQAVQTLLPVNSYQTDYQVISSN